MTAALDILHREHRAIAAVLHCLSHIVEETRAGKLAPEFEFFDAVISYMRDFPDRMHHPKEDEFFFKVLRTKAPELVPTLDALHEEHVAGDRLLAELDQKLDDWRKASEDTDRASTFLDEADAYVDFQRKHAAREERTVMPESRKFLDDADWEPINAAFLDNDDPMFGSRTQETYAKLFGKIVALAPQPWGLAQRTHMPTKTDKEALDTDHASWSEEQRRNMLALRWI